MPAPTVVLITIVTPAKMLDAFGAKMESAEEKEIPPVALSFKQETATPTVDTLENVPLAM